MEKVYKLQPIPTANTYYGGKLIQKKLLIITSYVTFAWVLYLIFCITDRKFSINIVDLLLQYSLTIF